jgi:DNA-binding MarR family transcriptional regulator
MKDCQEASVLENEMNSVDTAIMDWTAVFVRLWMHDINRYTRATGLSFGQMNLMLHIQYRGPCEVSEVSDLLQMTHAGASQMVERMVQQGLVTRHEVPGDRRVRLVHLTDHGKQVVQECTQVHQQWVEELSANLTPDEQKTASQVLKMLTEKAGQFNLG